MNRSDKEIERRIGLLAAGQNVLHAFATPNKKRSGPLISLAVSNKIYAAFNERRKVQLTSGFTKKRFDDFCYSTSVKK